MSDEELEDDAVASEENGIGEDLRLVRSHTPHGEFVGFQIVEYRKSDGAITDISNIPVFFEDEEDAAAHAHRILRASRLPVVDVETRFTKVH